MKRSAMYFGLFCLGGALAPMVFAADLAGQPTLTTVVTTPTHSYVLKNGPAGTKHAMPKSKILAAANALDFDGIQPIGDPHGYHDGYVARGFRAPYFSGDKFDVAFWACADNPDGFDCDNGFAKPEQIVMPTDVYKKHSNSCIRGILGHELFHHIQFGYTVDSGLPLTCGYFPAAACEGHARAMQDKIYFDLDLDPSASCVAPFSGETSAYLKKPDETIWDASYRSALFWTYLMEQYGAYRQEPGLGSDFLVNWWTIAQANMNKASIYEVTSKAIKAANPSATVLSSYHRFLLANTIKNTNLVGADAAFKRTYSYRDEDPVPLPRVNKMNLGKVVPTAQTIVLSNGLASGLAVSARRFGGSYYDFDLSQCPGDRMVEFKATGTQLQPINGSIIVGDAMFGFVGIDILERPHKVALQRASDWSFHFVRGATRKVRLALSGWRGDYGGNVSMRCLPPAGPPTVNGFGEGFALQTGEPGSVSHIDVELPIPGEPSRSANGLPASDFSIGIGAGPTPLLLPAIQKVREAASRMRVTVRAPNGLAAGLSDGQVNVGPLQVQRTAAVQVAAHAPEVMLAIDTSFSMGLPAGGATLSQLKSQLGTLTLGLPTTARLGLLMFAGTTAASPGNAAVIAPMAVLTAAQRGGIANALASVQPSTATRIRLTDVVLRAIAEFDARGGSGERHLVVFTDGGEAVGFDPDALAATARAAGLRVHFFALARKSDQPLLARLASDTSASYRYVDALAGGGIDAAALDTALQATTDLIMRRQSSALQVGTLVPGTTSTSIRFDANAEINGAVARRKVIRGRVSNGGNAVRLYRPDGAQVVAAPGVEILRTGDEFAFHVAQAPSGNWRLEMDGSAAGGSGSWQAQAAILDPAQQLRLAVARARPLDDRQTSFVVGDTLLIQAALLQLNGGAAPAQAIATLSAPDGSTQTLQLNDDGQFGDEQADDLVFSALYRATTAGSPSGFLDDESQAALRGSYGLSATVDLGTSAAPRQLAASTEFVLRSGSVADADGDLLPDRWEAAARCANPALADDSSDYDGDGLNLAAEYRHGSDPCDPDSDDGGEADGSEIARGRSPIDGNDDGVLRIRQLSLKRETSDHVDTTPLVGLAMVLRYDTDAGYSEVIVQRAPTPQGPFTTLTTLSAANATGTYIDRAVVVGGNYCYQLVPRTAAGAVAARSDIVCDTARLDSAPPRGSLILNDGAPRSSNTQLSARLAIDAESFIGMQMQLTLPDGSQTAWLPWAPNYPIDASAAAPGSVSVEVQFRDPAGNLSTIYSDDILLMAPATTGSVIGSVRSDTALGDPDIALSGVDISPSIDTESPLQTAIDGSFAGADLLPGTYRFEFEKDGYLPTSVDGVMINPAGTVNLGVVRLRKEVLFKDGFD